MKKETIEEVAENFWRNDETMSDYVQQAYITGFIAGSKWQQEQAKEMEKEQKIDDIVQFGIKYHHKYSEGAIKKLCENAEQYYNETYKNETK